MIRAIIFDCFGVLVGKSFSEVYRAAGGDPVKDAAFVEGMLEKVNGGAISGDLFATLMADKLGIPVAQYRATVVHEETPNEELFTYIRQELKPHYKLGLLSNAGSGSVESYIPASKLALFDDIIISADVGLQKPDPAIFRLAVDHLGTTFDETVFVDDLERFTTPAAQLGLHVIRYQGFLAFKESLVKVIR